MSGDWVEIDGSQGEGGGQILRTSLALSACLGQSIRIRDIRAGRPAPGLRPQHLVAVRAVAQICGVDLPDLAVGQTELVFNPGPIQPGKYVFEIRTAGSTCLVLQTVAIPLALTGVSSLVEITGGTHNPKAPCFEYLQQVWVPFLAKMGIDIEVEMPRAGFYPHGGGILAARIHGARRDNLRALNLLERGKQKAIKGVAKIANQPMNIGYRLCKAATWQLSRRGITGVEIETEVIEAYDQAGLCFLKVDFANTQAAFFGISGKAKSPEGASSDAAAGLADFLDETTSGGGATDPYAADQIMLPLALVPGISRFTTSRITEHCLTNAAVIRQITGRSVTVDGQVGQPGTVTIGS